MKFASLETRTKTFSCQVAIYKAADLPSNMEIQLPFATNVDTFLNVEALVEHGIDPMGLARQIDQMTVKNVSNNLSQRIKSAVKKNQPLPDQSTVDAMVAAYDFTGIRATSEEGQSVEERTLISEIRKALRGLVSDGSFAMLDLNGNKTLDPAEVVFNAVRVQTGPEAKGLKETASNSVPRDNFAQVVSAAYEGGIAEIEDGNSNIATLDFSIEPLFNEDNQALNLPGVVTLARQEATRILANFSAKSVPAAAFQIS